MEGWRNAFREVSNSKPLFLTIYGTVIVGVLVSAFYVFSAIYSPVTNSSSWFSSNISSNFHNKSQLQSFSEPNATVVPTPTLQLQGKWLRPIWEAPPPTEKMPPLETFKLTKELVEERVKDNVIIVTFGNFAFMDFILTWVKHLTDLGLSNLLVGAMDTKLLQALYLKGIPVFDMGSHMSTVDVGWGSPTFHKMGREKVILIDAILPFGFELLMCDTDMVWLKNPLPYLARYPDADVLTSSDQVVPTVVDDRLDVWQQVGAAYNIGIFHWRPTEAAKKLAKEWKEMLLADEKIWDQNGFNDIVRRQLGPSLDGDSGLVYAYDGNLKLGILPASIFCSGHTYFVQAMYQQLRLEPYAIHTTFQYAGTDGKRHRLREAMVFYDPPEYYDAPGGFLSFKPSIPKSLLLDGEHNIESHFSLVNYQIKQIRTALAIASLLNRTLVMPPLWCRLDRLWFGHPGVLVGSLTRQPFLCPLDHVFEVNVMLKEHPEEFGPRVGIREYSFLDNPSLPKQVKESWLDVHLCQGGSDGCRASNDTSPLGVLKFPKHSNQETFETIFSSFKDFKVIQFSSMQDAFLGFTDKTREEKFRKRVKRYVGIWCCVKLLKSSEPYCAVASTATSSSLHLKSRKQGIHIFSAGFFTFKPQNQPNVCNQKPSIQNSHEPISHKTGIPSTDIPPFPYPVQEPLQPDLPPQDPYHLPPLPLLPRLPPLPQLPPLPPLPGLPGFPPLTDKTKQTKPVRTSQVSDQKVAKPDFFFPPNPLFPPPSIFPPNPFQPPSVLPPNPFQPPPAPIIPLPPITIPGLTPSPPPPVFPFPFPPITFPPSPGFPGIPPASSLPKTQSP